MDDSPADPLHRRRLLVGVLSWLLLGAAWWGVLARDARTWLPQLLVPAVSVVVVTALTLLWVRHNLGIYERKGPRRGLPAVDSPWEHDSLGRALSFGPGVDRAAVVRLSLDGGGKHYRADA